MLIGEYGSFTERLYSVINFNPTQPKLFWVTLFKAVEMADWPTQAQTNSIINQIKNHVLPAIEQMIAAVKTEKRARPPPGAMKDPFR
jgi:hypothetical protein